jgi:flavodoxin
MRMRLIYDSQYGNTEKVAMAIAKVMQAHGEVTIARVGDVEPGQLAGLDLLVIGSPTHQFRASETMRAFLQSIPKDGLRGVKAATFDTRLTQAFLDKHPPLGFFEKIFGYAAGRIAKVIKERGGKVVVPPEGFYVDDTPGPLVEGELERAEEWAGKLFA